MLPNSHWLETLDVQLWFKANWGLLRNRKAIGHGEKSPFSTYEETSNAVGGSWRATGFARNPVEP